MLQRIGPGQARGRLESAVQRSEISSPAAEAVGQPAIRSYAVIDAESAAHHRLRRDLPGNTNARLDVRPIGIVDGTRLAVDAREHQAALDHTRGVRIE